MGFIRSDSTSWTPGIILSGVEGFGVLGSAVPSSGDNGPGYTYADLSLPADANKEICGRITTWPTLGGTFVPYENTSFTYSGPSDTFQYQEYVDGVAVGSPVTVVLNTAAVTHATSGALVAVGAALAATAARTNTHVVHTAFAVIHGAGAVLAGAASRTALVLGVHTTSGTMHGLGASLSGVSQRKSLHTTAGILANSGATLGALASSRKVTHDVVGSLVGGNSIIVGGVTHEYAPAVELAALAPLLVLQFRADFPEFSSSAMFPNSAVLFWMTFAGRFINSDRWGDSTNIGVELLTAHHLTLEARNLAAAQAGGIPGEQVGALNSKSVDKVSMGYDTGVGADPSAGHWNTTNYGTRYIALANLFGAGPIHIAGSNFGGQLNGPGWPGPNTFPSQTGFGS